MVNVFFFGKKYTVPAGLTIMTAMEYAGYQLKRGCGCRNGFCGACATIYRIKGDKANRAIAGLSMGGGGSTSYAQRHADMFCACYAMSALMHLPAPAEAAPKNDKDKMWHLTYTANKYSCVEYVKNADEATKQALRTVAWYVDCGADDFLFDCNLDLYQELRKARIACQLRVRDGGHTWEYWHSALYTALPYFSRIFGK